MFETCIKPSAKNQQKWSNKAKVHIPCEVAPQRRTSSHARHRIGAHQVRS